MSIAPVAVFAFNRADKLARVFEVLREVQPKDLFVGVDGPRADFPDDERLCGVVRDFLDTAVDWPCNVRRFDRSTNGGYDGNIELTLDGVFAEVTEAILVEDDCIPNPTFFRFCTELLDRYRDDERVAAIGGTNDDAPEELFDGNSYAFTTFNSIWGWATWARSWHAHRAAFPRPHDHTTERVQYSTNPPRFAPAATPRPFVGPTHAFTRPRAFARFWSDVGSGELSLGAWDQQWRLSMVNTGALSITPSKPLIENVGFDESSTSDMPTRSMTPGHTMDFPVVHPADVEVNPGVEDVMERTMLRAVGRLARRLRAVLPRGLRDTARRTGRVLIP
jgi:hypothetical protein